MEEFFDIIVTQIYDNFNYKAVASRLINISFYDCDISK